MGKKLLVLTLVAALLLGLGLSAKAGFPFPDPILGPIFEGIISPDPTPRPTPVPTPVPTPEPTPLPFDYGFDPGRVITPPTNTPLPIVGTISPGGIDIGPRFPIPFTPPPATGAPATPKPTAKPTAKPAQPPTANPASKPTAKPASKPTAKPASKPSAAQKGSNQKGAEVTSFGPYIEELRPRLTDKWYMATPLDLSKEGVTQYPLVAGNAHIIGQAQVTVLGGKLLVNYQPVNGVKVNSEFYGVFNSLDDMQTLSTKLLAPHGRAFGQPIDIASTFGGDSKVVLYLFLTADYQAKGKGISPFVPDQHRPLMQALMVNVD